MTIQPNKMQAQLEQLIQQSGLAYLTLDENFLLNLADQWTEMTSSQLVVGSEAANLYWQATGQWWQSVKKAPARVSQLTPFEDQAQMHKSIDDTQGLINQAMRAVETWVQRNEDNAFISSGKVVQLMLQRLADFQLSGQSQEELEYINAFWQTILKVWTQNIGGE